MADPAIHVSAPPIARGRRRRGTVLRWASILLGLALLAVGVTLIVRVNRAPHTVSVLEQWCHAVKAWLPWLPC